MSTSVKVRKSDSIVLRAHDINAAFSRKFEKEKNIE